MVLREHDQITCQKISDYFYHFQFPFFNVVLEMKRVNFNYQTTTIVTFYVYAAISRYFILPQNYALLYTLSRNLCYQNDNK
jgi:hypothetical protein